MTKETATLATRMKRIANVTERSMQRAHDALNWEDPADTDAEKAAVDAWWADHWATVWEPKYGPRKAA
jgi:hypothetical protein